MEQTWHSPSYCPANFLLDLLVTGKKVRCNVIPLGGFGDLQPLCVLAKMKFIWWVAQKDRWNAGSHSSSCWEAIVFLVSELLYREAHLTSLWGEGTSPFTYSTATKCRLQTNQSNITIRAPLFFFQVFFLSGPGYYLLSESLLYRAHICLLAQSMLHSLSECPGFVERYCICSLDLTHELMINSGTLQPSQLSTFFWSTFTTQHFNWLNMVSASDWSWRERQCLITAPEK